MVANDAGVTISVLAESTGVPVTTIKYYIAQGLLARGGLVAPNRALYGAAHVERLRLLRALVSVGGVSIAHLQRICAALDAEETTVALAAAQDAATRIDASTQASESSLRRIREHFGIDEAGALFNHPSVHAAAVALDEAAALIPAGLSAWVDAVLASGQSTADADIALLGTADTLAARVQAAVAGTALGDVILVHARRIAQSVAATEAFGPGPHRARPGAVSARRRQGAATR